MSVSRSLYVIVAVVAAMAGQPLLAALVLVIGWADSARAR